MQIHAGQKVILFDGECNLCNGFINYIIDRDEDAIFLFTALQSTSGRFIQKQLGLNPFRLDSILLYDPDTEQYYHKSTAAIRVLASLGGWWSLILLTLIFPRPLRNWAYDWVSRNRYRWFGRSACRIPTPDLRQRFLP